MKVRTTITLDEEVLTLAKIKLNMPLSTFCNNTLKEALHQKDEKKELEEEIKKQETLLLSLKSKYNQIIKEEKIINEIEKKCSVAMETINRIYNTHGVVGENQIYNVAKHNGINEGIFLNYVKSYGLKVINFL